ncbi:MAG: T9SS type A sorting domain-containing protein [Bacteroidota bacterium]
MKSIVNVFLIFVTLIVNAQDSKQWSGYFSYNSIKDLSISPEKVFAAAENAYFTREMSTNLEKKITTIEGLSGENITQIHHSEAYKKTIIGHASGLMIVVNEVSGEMLNVVDILNKPSVPSNKKRINHFNEYNGKLYISTDYGISVFDLSNSEFGDSFFIGPNGTNIEVFQTAVFNNTIYAVTNGYGLLSASVNNPFLVDYNQWTMAQSGNWASIESTSTHLALVNIFGGVYDLNTSNVLTPVASLPQVSLDVRYNGSSLVITTQNYVYVYNDALVEQFNVNNSANPAIRFSCGTMIGDKIFIGTVENGLLESTKLNPLSFINLSPNEATRNVIFGVKANYKGFWAVYGDYTSSLNPYPLDSFGISRYKDNSWIHVPYSTLFDAKSITSIVNKPDNQEEFFMSSFYSGLLHFKNEIPQLIYNHSNSTLTTIASQVPDDIRVGITKFDNSNNLWATTALTENQLHVFKNNGSWESFKMNCVQPGVLVNTKGIEIDKNDTKWIFSRLGLIGFNEKINKCMLLNDNIEGGNLPVRDVRAVAVDKRNKLWIGTTLGLRVLPSVDSFLSQSSLTTNPIIFLEEGVAQELLYQQFINDIVVDGSNNKWIATSGSGVFYVSDDGQKTFHHFTKANSPLPNDNVIDIDINEETGEVYFATEGGMVSYRGNATEGAENLKNVVIFPNPVRPEFKGNISITGLMDSCNVKITDIEGNLVHEAISEGGTILWDTTIFGKKKVASGVYMVHISSEDGLETEVKKVMVVR